MSKEIKESGKIWAKNAIPYKNKNDKIHISQEIRWSNEH